MPEVGKKTQTNINRRAPIVTVMGHVDHGKTSILDYIRKTNVQSREYGGITQHIGAYQVNYKSQKITFIDTPGHAAFTQMRARGGKASDIVILVVAADDGVMPQTREAISHARNAGSTIIVAINKSDLPQANPQKVKQELAQENVLVEDWGGDVIAVEVSAKTGKGIDSLLDSILAVSEMLNLNTDPAGELEAPIIEAKLDRKKGVVVTCIVRSGTISVTQEITASGFEAKVRSLSNENGESLKSANLGAPVEILGFNKVPNVGDLIVRKGSELAILSQDESRVEIVGKDTKKTVAVVIKADTQGTLEAVKASLANLVTSSVGSSFALKFIHTATGDITESDVMLAQSVKGIVVGFDVRLPEPIAELAREHKIVAKTYKTIYELIDEAEELLEGTALEEEMKIKGRAQILKLFKLPSGDVIAGAKVLAGALKENSRISIYDKDPADLKETDIPLYTGSIKKLKKGKDEVKVVGKDNECGLLLKPTFDGIKEGLWVEVR